MIVKIKKLSEKAIMPEKKTAGAAAYDVFIPRETVINPGRNVVRLDLAIELPEGYEAKIEARSGFSARGMAGLWEYYDVTHDVTNLQYSTEIDADVIPGKIDCDYRGNIGVIIYSRMKDPFTLLAKLRIAQMTIYKVESADFELCDELSETDRAEGGFGSTGTL